MASFARAAAPPRREWSVEDAARFAAVKEFELLQLLSTDAPGCRSSRGFCYGTEKAERVASRVAPRVARL